MTDVQIEVTIQGKNGDEIGTFILEANKSRALQNFEMIKAVEVNGVLHETCYIDAMGTVTMLEDNVGEYATIMYTTHDDYAPHLMCQ